MAAVEDLTFKTGCCCALLSFYLKFQIVLDVKENLIFVVGTVPPQVVN